MDGWMNKRKNSASLAFHCRYAHSLAPRLSVLFCFVFVFFFYIMYVVHTPRLRFMCQFNANTNSSFHCHRCCVECILFCFFSFCLPFHFLRIFNFLFQRVHLHCVQCLVLSVQCTGSWYVKPITICGCNLRSFWI